MVDPPLMTELGEFVADAEWTSYLNRAVVGAAVRILELEPLAYYLIGDHTRSYRHRGT